MKTLRQKIINTIHDSVSDLLYYDRKEDFDLPLNAIEDAVNSGIISVDEMVECYRDYLEKSLNFDV